MSQSPLNGIGIRRSNGERNYLKEMKSASLAKVMMRFVSGLGTGKRCFSMFAVLSPIYSNIENKSSLELNNEIQCLSVFY